MVSLANAAKSLSRTDFSMRCFFIVIFIPLLFCYVWSVTNNTCFLFFSMSALKVKTETLCFL